MDDKAIDALADRLRGWVRFILPWNWMPTPDKDFMREKAREMPTSMSAARLPETQRIDGGGPVGGAGLRP